MASGRHELLCGNCQVGRQQQVCSYEHCIEADMGQLSNVLDASNATRTYPSTRIRFVDQPQTARDAFAFRFVARKALSRN